MAVAGNHGSLRPLDRVVGLGQEAVGKSPNGYAGQKSAKAPSTAPKGDFAAQLVEPSNSSPKPPVVPKHEPTKSPPKPAKGKEFKKEPSKELGREVASKNAVAPQKEPSVKEPPVKEPPAKEPLPKEPLPKETLQTEAGTETTEATTPRNLKTEIKGLPVVALLTGRLEALKPQDITQLVAENGFVKSAVTEPDIVGFFEKPVEIESLLRDLGVSEEILQGLRLNGVDLSTMGTPLGLFKSVGIDAQQVRSELTILRDNLSLGTIGDYLKRAQVLSKGAPSPGMSYGEEGLGGPTGQSPLQTGPVRSPVSTVSPDDRGLAAREEQVPKMSEPSHHGISPQGAESLAPSGLGQAQVAQLANPQLATKAGGKSDLGNNKISSKAFAPPDKGQGMLSRPSGASLTSLFQGPEVSFAEESPWAGQTLWDGFDREVLTPGLLGIETFATDQIPMDPLKQPVLQTMGTSLQPQAQAASFDHWYAMGQKIGPQGQVPGQGEMGEFGLRGEQENAVPKKAVPREELVLQKIGPSDQRFVRTEDPKQQMNIKIPSDSKASGLEPTDPGIEISASQNQLRQDLDRTPSAEKGATETVRGPRDFMESWTQGRQAMGQSKGIDHLQNKGMTSLLQPSSLSMTGTASAPSEVALQRLGLTTDSINLAEMRASSPGLQEELTKNLESLSASSDQGFDQEGQLGIRDQGDSKAMGILAGGRSEDQNQRGQGDLGQGDGFRNSMTSQERAQWVQKIFDGAHMLLSQGGGQIRLTMPQTPWGSLDVALNMTNQKMDIRVLAGDDGIREALAVELGQLGDLLNARNIELGKIEVGLSGVAINKGSQAGSQQNSQGGSQQSGDQRFKDHAIHQDWLQDMRSQVKLAQFDQLRTMTSPRLYQKDSENYGNSIQNTVNKII